MPQPQNEVQPVEKWQGEFERGGPLSPLQVALADTTPEYLTTMPVETPEQKIMMYRALNEDHTPIKAVLNVPIDVVGYVVRPSGMQVGEDGVVSYFPITVLILDDGRFVRSGSRGIVQCVRQLSWVRGPAPWDPPVKCVPRIRPLADGKNWYALEVLP